MNSKTFVKLDRKMTVKERSVNAESYKYGFGGQDKDNEVYGDGNTYNFDYRIHDTRIGRFLSVDPLAKNFPWNSPYSFAENSPIRFIELEGKERAEPKMFELTKEMISVLRNGVNASNNNQTQIKGLSRTDVLNQLDKMMDLVHDQKNISACNDEGWFCDPLTVLGVVAINNPMAYASMVWDLATNGKTDRDGDLKPGIKLPEWLDDVSLLKGDEGDVKYQPIDMMMMYSLRGSENDFFASNKDLITNYSKFNAGTLPWELNDMIKRMGMTIKSQSFYLRQHDRTLKKLEKATKDGYTPIIFDTEAITEANINDKIKLGETIKLNLGIHYIILTNIKRNKLDKTVTYDVTEHGDTFNRTVSYKDFKKGMKGYWIPKNK